MNKRVLFGCGTLLLTFFTSALVAQVASAAGTPVLSGYSQSSIPAGAILKVTGSNFDDNSRLYLYPEDVVPSAVTPTELTFTVPLEVTWGAYNAQIHQANTSLFSNTKLLTITRALPIDVAIDKVAPYNEMIPGDRMVIYGVNKTFSSTGPFRPNYVETDRIAIDGDLSRLITPTYYSELSLEYNLPSWITVGSHKVQVARNGVLSNALTFKVTGLVPYTPPVPVLRSLKIHAGPEVNPTATYNSGNVQLDEVTVVGDNLVSGDDVTVFAYTQVYLDGKKIDSQFAGGDPQPLVFTIPPSVTPGDHLVSLFNPDKRDPSKGEVSVQKLTLKVIDANARPSFISGVGANLGGWDFVPLDREGVSIRVSGAFIDTNSTAILDGKLVPSSWMNYWGGLLDVPVPADLTEGTHTMQVGSKDGKRPLSNKMTFVAKKVGDATPEESNEPAITTVDPIRVARGKEVTIQARNVGCNAVIWLDKVKVSSSGCATVAPGAKFTIPQTTLLGSAYIYISDPSSGKKSSGNMITILSGSGSGTGTGTGINTWGDDTRVNTSTGSGLPPTVAAVPTLTASPSSVSDYIAKLKAKIAAAKADALKNTGIVPQATTVPVPPKAVSTTKQSETCVGIVHNLATRSADKKNDNDVMLLQSFLVAGDYLRTAPTGYYGAMTAKAVKAFQKEHGITQTGTVGPQTKAKIKNLTCQ